MNAAASPINVRDLTDTQAAMILTVQKGQWIQRGGFRGTPFHITDGQGGRILFSEELVNSLIEGGVLQVLQRTMGVPAEPEGLPFNVSLTRHGADLRATLLSNQPRRATA